jgi:hypothetical protein
MSTAFLAKTIRGAWIELCCEPEQDATLLHEACAPGTSHQRPGG